MAKVYTDYDEIDRDLEILALEKEIQFQKMMQSFDKTKDSLSPGNLIGDVPKMALSAIAGPVKTLGITFLLKKIFGFGK